MMGIPNPIPSNELASEKDAPIHKMSEAGFRKRVVGLGFVVLVVSVLISFFASFAFCSARPVIHRAEALILSIVIPLVVAPIGVWINSHQQMRVFHLLKENYKLANHDVLTGLMNRRAFFSKASVLINHAGNCPQQLAAFIVDVDDFKEINDTYGHEVGDESLRMIAGRLTAVLPSDALVARIGGEEFAILVFAESAKATHELGKSLCESVANESAFDFPRQLTISVGICLWEEGLVLSTLLSRADAALYHSKATGKNRVSVSSDEKTCLAISEVEDSGEVVLSMDPVN